MFTFRFLPALLSTFVLMPGLFAYAADAPRLLHPAPSADGIGYMPAAGAVAASNPPAMTWVDEKGATSWTLQIDRLSGDFTDAIQVDDWPYLMYTHTEALPAGDWSWRYRFTTASGQVSNWSKPSKFTIQETTPRFARPSAEHLRKTVPAQHPRMFTRPDTIGALKAAANDSSPQFRALMASADSALSASLMAEPTPWTGGKWNAGEWGAYLRESTTSTNIMNTLAYAWLLSGKAEYGARAKQHLMNYVAWDPDGPSNMAINDEVGMPVLYSISRTYDWIYPLLSEQEKTSIRKVMRERGQETFLRLRKKPYEQYPHNSHFGRMWHFLGEAGVSFYGEIPEAEEWLNYAMTTFYGWYPYWGDSEGGWAEGMAYWSSYSTLVTYWLDLMRESLGIDGAQKPFYAHVGDFPFYVCPPGSPVGGFGDFSERPTDMKRVGSTLATFAKYRQNSLWQWYAEQVDASTDAGLFSFIRSRLPAPPAAKPSGLPLLKLFSRAGNALFHSDLTHPSDNVHIAMRSSPFGNVSHSHNDQNAIVMAAFGEPLLVNTGTRDFYGSPFCKQYYWLTKSHNALLLDGQGQPRGLEYTGRFIASGQDDRFAWTVGDATKAYGNLAKMYRRWLIYLPQTGAILVDELDTTASVANVLFHGRAPFTTDDAAGAFALQKGKALLAGQVFQPETTTGTVVFHQTDQYPLPLGNNKTPLFDEWHLSSDVKLTGQPGKQFIITVLEAQRSANQTPSQGHWSAEQQGDHLKIAGVAGTGTEVALDIDLVQLQVELGGSSGR